MKAIDYKKFLDENNPENIIVHVVLRATGKEYECAGVLMIETENMIRVAFNAKDDKVKDYLDIKRTDIISINILKTSDIVEL